jgi:nucleoside-diphosphate-sugar epimerase
LKVLLTGATGFVGSHILDNLAGQGIRCAALLRPSSDKAFLPSDPAAFEIRRGSIDNVQSLTTALEGITHVIHCAGRTSACRSQEFFETNHIGTRNVVEAVNARNGQVRRLVHISSLAATGPGTPDAPSTESSVCRPVSHYGRSKLAAEHEVLKRCKTDWSIIRPPAVYGPRDNGFLPLFKAVGSHLLPRTNSSQALSLVFVEDLAQAVTAVLKSPAASRKIYFAACPEIVTARQMAACIAARMKTWTVPVPLPALGLWPLCAAQEVYARITGRPRMLNLQKFAELSAPGWVCDSTLLAREIGCVCQTRLETGVARTLDWYLQNDWL